MKNIHVLPTDKPSRLHNKNGELGNYPSTKLYIEDFKGNQHNSFHIYITSDEEIKEGDWYYYNSTVRKHVAPKGYSTKDFKKIILTTDQDLIKDGVQPIDDEFLEWFVKNPSCEEVEVKYDKDIFPYGVETSNGYGWYKIIIPKEEPKQETLEETAELILLEYYSGVMDGDNSFSLN